MAIKCRRSLPKLQSSKLQIISAISFAITINSAHAEEWKLKLEPHLGELISSKERRAAANIPAASQRARVI